MGDAALRWVVQSHLLIPAYHSEASIWPLNNPTTHHTLPMGIDAYMDDTNQLLRNYDNNLQAPLLPNAQANIDLWQGLIQASSGTLNPTKCSWTLFLWVFDQLGNAHLAEPPDWPLYHITAPDHQGCQHTLTCNSPSTAV